MIGVDEAGRGAWAGDLVVAAVKFTGQLDISDLNDSKQLTASQRQWLADQLTTNMSATISYGFVNAVQISQYGLTWAQKQAMQQAVEQLQPEANEVIIVDGKINYLRTVYESSRAVIKADGKYLEVMAASVLAKVKRDQSMIDLAQKYPGYGFDKHKGYGTLLHQQALQTLGFLKTVHRLNYRPLGLYSPNQSAS